MPLDQLPIKQFFYFIILIICGLFAFVFYEFHQVEEFESRLTKSGFKKVKSGEHLSTLWDGVLYFWTRDEVKKLSKYKKNIGDIQVEFEHQLTDTKTSRGGVSWLPDIRKSLIVTGRRNKLSTKEHFACDSNLSTRNTRVQELGTFFEEPKLANGIELHRCYSNEAIKLLEGIKLPVDSINLRGVVYPVDGRLEVGIVAIDIDSYLKQMDAVVVYYESLTVPK